MEVEIKNPFGYVWEEHWKDEDTQNGPGDYNSELIFDTQLPNNGEYEEVYTKQQVEEFIRLALLDQ